MINRGTFPNTLVSNSQLGMFLWVSLILIKLEDADTIGELHEAVDLLPKQLGKIYQQILQKIEDKLSVKEFNKVLRVLGWIAFVRRSVKSYEIEYGAILCPTNTTLSHETKPLGNFLQLCKPIVEEQPNQFVGFIHFSVKEYTCATSIHKELMLIFDRFLLSTMSGPLINPLQAQYDISFACVAYLNGAFDILSPKHEALVKIGQCFHSLQLYANSFWLDHLVDCISLGFVLDSNSTDPLIQQLSVLHQTHADLIQGNSHLHKPSLTDAEAVLQNERLRVLTSWMGIYTLAHQILADRSLTSNPQSPQSKFPGILAHQTGLNLASAHHSFLADHSFMIDTETNKDEPILSQMRRKYNSYVRELLDADTIIGLSPEELRHFRDTYGPSAYVCKYENCKAATTGFASRKALVDHESSHDPKFICNVTSCDFSVIGFSTLANLRRHKLYSHSAKVPEYIPQSLRQINNDRHSQLLAHTQTRERDTSKNSSANPRGVTRLDEQGISSTDHDMITSDDGALNDDVGDGLEICVCICGYYDDDGAMLICEICHNWQHILCYYNDLDGVPEIHHCVDCSPRDIDRVAAIQRQKRLRAQRSHNRRTKGAAGTQNVNDTSREDTQFDTSTSVDQSEPSVEKTLPKTKAEIEELASQGERLEAEIKETLAAEHNHYLDLYTLVKQAATLPVSKETLAEAEALLKKQRDTQEQILSLYGRTKHLDFRQRPLYREVRDFFEALNMLKDKPTGTLDLEKEAKRHEDWMRRGKKLFGKANAPLHILLQHMKLVSDRNEACFDTSDKPRMSTKLSSMVNSSYEDQDIFCICRRPQSGLMIECELCQEWWVYA